MTKSSLINNGHIKAVQTEKREEEKKKKNGEHIWRQNSWKFPWTGKDSRYSGLG